MPNTICNDSKALNELLIERGLIDPADRLKEKYFGKLTLSLQYGNVVHIEKKEELKPKIN